MRKARLFAFGATLALLASLAGARILANAAAAADQTPAQDQPAATQPGAPAAGDNFDFFSDQPVQSKEIVELPPEKSRWITIGGPLALVGFFFFLIAFFWWMVPFRGHTTDINLQ
jgi:hypothetical protein